LPYYPLFGNVYHSARCKGGLSPAVFAEADSWLVGFIDHEAASATPCTGRTHEIHGVAEAGTRCGNHHRRSVGLPAGSSGRFCVGRFSSDNRQPVAAKLFGLGRNLVRLEERQITSRLPIPYFGPSIIFLLATQPAITPLMFFCKLQTRCLCGGCWCG